VVKVSVTQNRMNLYTQREELHKLMLTKATMSEAEGLETVRNEEEPLSDMVMCETGRFKKGSLRSVTAAECARSSRG
jgi:hypothetical protein